MWLRVIASLYHCWTFHVFGLTTLLIAKIVYSRWQNIAGRAAMAGKKPHFSVFLLLTLGEISAGILTVWLVFFKETWAYILVSRYWDSQFMIKPWFLNLKDVLVSCVTLFVTCSCDFRAILEDQLADLTLTLHRFLPYLICISREGWCCFSPSQNGFSRERCHTTQNVCLYGSQVRHGIYMFL